MAQFSKTEKEVIALFKPGVRFTLEDTEWTVITCAKPRPSSGECKTDVYLLVENSDVQKEIKISIKQDNADFLENKIKHERAVEIFGQSTDIILSKSLESIKGKFEEQYLVLFNNYKKTEAKTIKLGWKFELVNKPNGALSGALQLTHEQLVNVYSGTNIPDDKRNALVNGKLVAESGVANYIMVINQDVPYTIEYCIKHLTSVEDYVSKHDKIYFACKALNYRVSEGKWDGDRPLSVYVEWTYLNGQLCGNLNFKEPLMHKGNEIGNHLSSLLKKLGVDENNFDTLKTKLHSSVKFL